MARILVKAVNEISLDPQKSAFLYQRGDVVKVVNDGYYFGGQIEGNKNPRFSIIDVPGESASSYRELTEMITTGSGDDWRIEGRRRKKLDVDSLTGKEKDDFDGATRQITLSSVRLSGLIKDK